MSAGPAPGIIQPHQPEVPPDPSAAAMSLGLPVLPQDAPQTPAPSLPPATVTEQGGGTDVF